MIKTGMLSISPPNIDNCICIMVTFNPDAAIRDRIESILKSQLKLLIVDNSTQERARHYIKSVSQRLDVEIISNHFNQGLGYALNQGFRYALMHAYEWCIFFDQDTVVYPNFFKTLSDCISDCGNSAALFGSNYKELRGAGLRYKRNKEENKTYIETKTVITSGAMMPTRFYQDLGGYREDYFIDSIDHEFCLRCRSHGIKVFLSTLVSQEHLLGDTRSKTWPLNKIPRHAPNRKYYIARNVVTTIKLYWRHETLWCVKQISRLVVELLVIIVLEDDKRKKTREFLKGIIDGLTGRMGSRENHA